MRATASASSTPARPIISDDAFHGGEDISHIDGRYEDTAFGRKRVTPENESADMVPPDQVRRSPVGAIPLHPTPPVAPAGAFSDRNGPAQ